MSNHKGRLAKLEAAQAPNKTQRLIVLKDGIYTERGQVIAEADYKAIESDPAYDVTLLKIVYASATKHSEQPVN